MYIWKGETSNFDEQKAPANNETISSLIFVISAYIMEDNNVHVFS